MQGEGEQREDIKGVAFYLLPMEEVHCGGRNLPDNEEAAVSSRPDLLAANRVPR